MTLAFMDSAAKAALLSQIDATMETPAEAPPIAGGRRVPTSAAVVMLARDTGLHPAFILLVHALQVQDRPFAATAVQAVPAGLDTLDCVRRWLLRSWERLRAKVSDDAVLAHGEAIVALHRTTLAGEMVEPARWRALRRLSVFAGKDRSIAIALAGAMPACAWDLQTVPGAAADLVQALEFIADAEAEARIGWTEDHSARHRQYVEDREAAVAAAIGVQPVGEGKAWHADDAWHATEAGQAWHRGFKAAWAAYNQSHPYDLPDRWSATGEARKGALAIAREDLLAEVAVAHRLA
jgi:hypothetical protein